jgi:hypothetical protein
MSQNEWKKWKAIMKNKKTFFKLSLSTLPIISTSISLSSCNSVSPDDKEIEKCNYKVKSYQEITKNDSNSTF